MKKLMPIIFLGIFLIGFIGAAQTVEILQPFTQPTLIVTNVSGGGWAAGTYKFVAVVGEYYRTSFWDAGIRISPSSNIFEINLSEGDGVILNYTDLDPTAPRIYFHAIKITAGTDNWLNIGSTSAESSSGYLLSSYPTGVTILDDTWFALRTRVIERFDEDTPYNLNISKGVCVINVTSTATSTLSFTTLIGSLETNSSPLISGQDIITYGTSQLITTCSILLNKDVSNPVQFTGGQDIASWGGIVIGDNANVITTDSNYGFVNIKLLRQGGWGSSLTINTGAPNYLNIGSLYERYIINGIYYGEVSGGGINFGSTVTGYGSVIASQWASPYFGQKEFYIKSGLLSLSTPALNLINQRLYLYLQNNVVDTLSKDNIIAYTNHYTLLNLRPSSSTSTTYSLDNIFINVTDREPLKFPIVYVLQYATYGDSNDSITIGNTFTLTVNENVSTNQPVVNANVSIYDVNDTLVYNGLTATNGSVTTPLWWGMVVAIDNAYSGIRDDNKYIIDKNPYTIKIEKSGYKTYEGSFEMDKELDWTISLEEQPSWNYSIAPIWGIRNDSSAGIFKLSPTGDLAIAGKLYENTNSPPFWNLIYKVWNGVAWLDIFGNLYINGTLSEEVKGL